MQRDYHGFIFTKHALERLESRGVSQDIAVKVLQKPDLTLPVDKPNTTKFIRKLNDRNIQLVATYLADQKKWLVVSVWVRGEEDRVPLLWQLLVAPFKIGWWFVRKLVKISRQK